MIGGAILAAWTPFWTFASTLGTLDFMRTSSGQPSIGNFFLPPGISSGLNVVGIGVMVCAFIQLAHRNGLSHAETQSRPEITSTPNHVPLDSESSGSGMPFWFSAKTTLPDGREIHACTVDQLQEVYNANTVDQVDRLLRGKWVKVAAKVLQNYGAGSIYVDCEKPRPFITLKFTEDWVDQLSLLERGSGVMVRGKIVNVDHYGIHLSDCELL